MRRRDWLWAAAIAAAAVAAAAAAERLLAIRVCGGEYVYPIDDTYIHMAMAKNLVLHGVWGVEPGRMAFCSSSPLWTLVLSSGAAVFGLRDALPWLLALGFNVLSTFVVCGALSRLGANVWTCLGGALAVAAAGPFLSTTALGMEHAMHGFFVLATLAAAAGLPRMRRRGVVLACALAAAATASRYESLFVLLPLGVGLGALEAYGRWRAGRRPFPPRAGAFLVAAVAPVFVYGVWAVLNGGRFLPNSLLLKGNFMTVGGLVRTMVDLLGSVRPGCGFLYLLALSLGVVLLAPGTRPYGRVAAASCIAAVGGQLLFADVGQLCRYEAYLTAAGAFVVVAEVVSGGLGRSPAVRYVELAAFALTGWTFLARAEQTFGETVRSSSDICSQQVLMTRMMAALPDEDRGCVALNDLGYMALHGGFPILDIWGLGSQDAAELLLKHRGTWLRSDYETLFPKHDVKYVVAFELWYPMYLMPSGTVDVAVLTLKNNFACGADTVVFRATSPDAADRLQRHLETYVDRMPPRARLWICRSAGSPSARSF